ncbi:MAG: pantetheine-phosphate adenylyltransferase, partial [Candidatus Latescibacterota bacterium]
GRYPWATVQPRHPDGAEETAVESAIYPGSFDPITYGHLNIIERALEVFERVIVLVAINPLKRTLFTTAESVEMIREATAHWPRLEVDHHAGLLVDYARARGVRTAVRGLRAVTDFESEFAMALTNRSLWPEFDTVFLMTRAEYMYLSSSVVRQVALMGGDVRQFVPPGVERRLRERYGQPARVVPGEATSGGQRPAAAPPVGLAPGANQSPCS